MTLAVVIAHCARGGVGQPVERYLGENLLLGHETRTVAEVLKQLVVCQLAHGRIRECGSDRLRASSVHLVVSTHRLEPAEKLQGRVLLGTEFLELARITGRKREEL